MWIWGEKSYFDVDMEKILTDFDLDWVKQKLISFLLIKRDLVTPDMNFLAWICY
jgi:hypothetical protein